MLSRLNVEESKNICQNSFLSVSILELRHCATNRKVASSIPDGVIGIFHWHNPFGPGVDSACNRMSTRNISWAVKPADT
jgi:hypothetical protein